MILYLVKIENQIPPVFVNYLIWINQKFQIAKNKTQINSNFTNTQIKKKFFDKQFEFLILLFEIYLPVR